MSVPAGLETVPSLMNGSERRGTPREAPLNSPWTPLLPLAMVGTERQAAALPVWPGEVGQLVVQAASSASALSTGVLRAAAVLATCSLAGARGPAWHEPMPAPAARDSLPELPPGPVLGWVQWTLQQGPARLQQQGCLALAEARYRLPAALLPQALELGRRSLALRPLLAPVLGERGLWLAAQREEWRYAAGVSAEALDESRWTEGSFEQRRAFLLHERALDPAAARERLTQSLAELAAKERADLVTVLADRLGPDDEPLLDSLRPDRSREVRQAALGLLLRLPEAKHPQRALQRIAALLEAPQAPSRPSWRIEAPAAAGSDWKLDNLDPLRPKHESLGERAWWLYQLVRQVPLAAWTRHTGLTPAELLRWADAGDWAEALLRGWRDVLFAAPEAAWCEALLDEWPKRHLRDETAAVLALLPLPARERHWQRQLSAGSAAPVPFIVHQLLSACAAGEMLTPALSQILVETIRQRAQSRQLDGDYMLRPMLPELCCVLPIGVLDRLAQLPRHADETASFAEALHATSQVIAARQAFHALTNPLNPASTS